LLLFALIPGLPTFSFLVLSALMGGIAWVVQQKQLVEEAAPKVVEAETLSREENYEEMLNVDLLELEVGYGLIPFVDASQKGELLTRIQGIRRQFTLDMGFIVPPIHIKDNLQLKPNEYTVLLKESKSAAGRCSPAITWP
jgi:flagellar biosynthesis protein FlhA